MGRSWLSYELLQGGTCSSKQGLFNNSARRLMGTRSNPFEQVVRELTEPLDEGDLYILDPACARALRLLPFVKVLSPPRTEANACYFYSRQQGENHRLISYHFAQESDVVRQFADISNAIDTIFPPE